MIPLIAFAELNVLLLMILNAGVLAVLSLKGKVRPPPEGVPHLTFWPSYMMAWSGEAPDELILFVVTAPEPSSTLYSPLWVSTTRVSVQMALPSVGTS